MGAFLARLGEQLAERWLTLLVLPGALYLAIVRAALTSGQTHAFDLSHLARQVTVWATEPAVRTVGGQVVLLAAVLAAAAVVGVAARSLGAAIEHTVLAADWNAWPAPLRRLAAARVTARRSRWDAARLVLHLRREEAGRARALRRPHDPTPLHEARRALDRISPERPERPTWTGDRVNAATVRLRRDHHLETSVVWPHLWLTLPETDRSEISSARQELRAAYVLAAWAVLYAPLTAAWWPAAVISLLLATTARRRSRVAAEAYAQLVEAAVRLHTGDLARALGIEHSGTLSPDIGDALGDLLESRLPEIEVVAPDPPTPPSG